MFSMHQRQPGETYNQSYPFMTDNSTDPSSLFRNNPNNPFWAVPSSMGVDDWQEFFKS
jgi:hypothetical protein